MLQKIYQFRKPMTNYEIPQNALLKNRFFYEFLLSNDRQIANEIRQEYIDTLSKVYFSYFKAYSSKLMKLQVSKRSSYLYLTTAFNKCHVLFFLLKIKQWFPISYTY